MSIQGKVANILNERDLVINKGSEDGVSEGMFFKVTQPDVPVRDPDSGTELGVLTREKIRVRVFEIHPRFSVAKTYETYKAPVPSVAETAIAAFRSQMVTRTRKIIAEPSPNKRVTIDVEGSSVSIGDTVIEITE
jgi:hypothetical protein